MLCYVLFLLSRSCNGSDYHEPGSEMSDSDDTEFERDRRSEKTVTTGTQIKW